MKLLVKKGTTSVIAHLFIQDSSSVVGAGLTGLAWNSGSLVAYYARTDQGNAGGTSISLQAGTRGTYASGGFVEKDSTNMPGVYEFGIPDAALATGANSVIIMLKGATNMAPCVLEIELTTTDLQDGTRMGMTALPNAAAGAAGGLLVVGNMRFQKNVAYNNFVFRMTASSDHVTPASGLGTGVTAQVSKDGGAFGATVNTVSEIGSGWYKLSLDAADLNANSVALKFTATGADQLDVAIFPQVD